jgi:hypothetical protein
MSVFQSLYSIKIHSFVHDKTTKWGIPKPKIDCIRKGKHRLYTEPDLFQHKEKLKIGGKVVFKIRGCSFYTTVHKRSKKCVIF